MNSKLKNFRGFTIVELLMVTAIAAMILSIVFVLYNDSRKRTRDSRREEDIKEIQNALNLFAVNNQVFPACGILGDVSNPESGDNTYVVLNGTTDCLSQDLVGESLIAVVPTDPLAGDSGTCGTAGNNVYCYVSDGFSYILRYSLETDNILGKDSGWQSVVVQH